MISQVINEGPEKTFAVIFDMDDEVMHGLLFLAKEFQLTAARFTAIGAFGDATLGYFDCEKKDYDKIPVREQVEVLSLDGDIAMSDGKPQVHAHAVLGKRDGTTCGGHLLEAHVRPTLEVVLTESPAYLRRTYDRETGLALIRLTKAGGGV